MEIGIEHFTCQGSGLCKIFKLIFFSTSKKVLNINVEVRRQVVEENSSLVLAVLRSKTSRA